MKLLKFVKVENEQAGGARTLPNAIEIAANPMQNTQMTWHTADECVALRHTPYVTRSLFSSSHKKFILLQY